MLEAGELLWRANTACQIMRTDADSARVRVLGLVICDYTASASVHAFAGHDTDSILYTDTPLRIDMAVVDPHGVVHISRSEVAMLRNVELEVIAATHDSACESPRSACSGSDSSNVTTGAFSTMTASPQRSRCSRGAHSIATSFHARATRGCSLPSAVTRRWRLRL